MATAPSAAQPAAAEKPPSGRRRVVLLALLVAAIGGAAYYGHYWWQTGRFMTGTDDAYVAADFAIVAPKVAGYVRRVAVEENSAVRAGDVLVELDDADYRVAVATAEAHVASQQATIDRLAKEQDAAQALVLEAKAKADAAAARQVQAAADFDRYASLARSSYASQQSFENARAARDQAQAAVAEAQAGIASAEANRAVTAASRIEAEQVLKVQQAALDRAQLDLDHTVLRASFDGVVGNKAVAAGNYVSPGTRLIALVPLDGVYIDANFKETQIAELTPGTPVHIEVDAYPGRDFTATVESLSPASGSVFSLLPPENATGNFTKIVQRVPVRLAVPEAVRAEGWLRPGLSVVATADTREHGARPAQAERSAEPAAATAKTAAR